VKGNRGQVTTGRQKRRKGKKRFFKKKKTTQGSISRNGEDGQQDERQEVKHESKTDRNTHLRVAS
jgi:hypothetical protein